ncbi:hypothetical protein ACTHGU_20590 [Chitinophagaceae bacterium MMS25-I14]
MKKIITTALTLSVLVSCHKGDDQFSKAVITGYDYRKCSCCGGLMMNFGDNTQQYDSNFYLVSQLPAGTSIGAADIFPIKVYVQWKPDTNYHCGSSNRIIITQLIKR